MTRASQSTKNKPADFVAQLLVVKHELANFVWKLRPLHDHPDSELVTLTIEQLYDSALVQEGLHPNPTEMLPRIEKLLELAVAKE